MDWRQQVSWMEEEILRHEASIIQGLPDAKRQLATSYLQLAIMHGGEHMDEDVAINYLFQAIRIDPDARLPKEYEWGRPTIVNSDTSCQGINEEALPIIRTALARGIKDSVKEGF